MLLDEACQKKRMCIIPITLVLIKAGRKDNTMQLTDYVVGKYPEPPEYDQNTIHESKGQHIGKAPSLPGAFLALITFAGAVTLWPTSPNQHCDSDCFCKQDGNYTFNPPLQSGKPKVYVVMKIYF